MSVRRGYLKNDAIIRHTTVLNHAAALLLDAHVSPARKRAIDAFPIRKRMFA